MNISYNWLKQFIDFQLKPKEVGDILTSIGLEVEAIEQKEKIKGSLEGLVVGEILNCEKHPNADNLSITSVNLGAGNIVPIVCGASNVTSGIKVIVATVGTTLFPLVGDSFIIKKAKIRGEVSEGMICAEDEIGLGVSHSGIVILNTELPEGSPVSQLYDVGKDSIFTIGLTPNRADAASHLGVARDLRAALLHRQMPCDTLKMGNLYSPSIHKKPSSIQVIVENLQACKRYSGLVIKNIQVQSSPEWLKQSLESIGVTPINNVIDITNYILHDLGQPLHAYDLDKIKGNKIIVGNPQEGWVLTTLDGKKRILKSSDLIISDDSEPLCIAGVLGGLESSISTETTAVFLESAFFDASVIRKTSATQALKTDASFRFERGTDPNMVITALIKAAFLVVELAGGIIEEDFIDVYPTKMEAVNIKVLYKNINRLIGFDIPKEEINSILLALHIEVVDSTNEGFVAIVPPFKVDVLREADLIEEIIRIYGFENIHVNDHLGSQFLASLPDINKFKIDNALAAHLIANGFNEIICNSLTNASYALEVEESDENIMILNKLSDELGAMRRMMVFSGLEAIAYNINRRQKDLKFFEYGKTYRKADELATAKSFKECSHLSLYLTGSMTAESWKQPSRPINFGDLYSEVLNIFSVLNIQDLIANASPGKEVDQHIYIEKNGKALASLGRVKPKLCKLFNIKQAVYYADFNMDHIYKLIKSKLVYSEIPRFPEVRRDLSLVLNKNITFQELQKVAMKVEREVVTEINLFDVYEGEKIEKDKKAYAVSFILSDSEQTLTDSKIEATMKRLIQAFTKELGAIIRE